MTAQELVSKIWQIGLMDPVAVRMENAAALVEAYGMDRWQRGWGLGWRQCEEWINWKPEEDRL